MFFHPNLKVPNKFSKSELYIWYELVGYLPFIRNIYTYSFAIHPLNVNPSGSLDFSDIKSDRTSFLRTSDILLHMLTKLIKKM